MVILKFTLRLLDILCSMVYNVKIYRISLTVNKKILKLEVKIYGIELY